MRNSSTDQNRLLIYTFQDASASLSGGASHEKLVTRLSLSLTLLPAQSKCGAVVQIDF
jgi:hypothetical protein